MVSRQKFIIVMTLVGSLLLLQVQARAEDSDITADLDVEQSGTVGVSGHTTLQFKAQGRYSNIGTRRTAEGDLVTIEELCVPDQLRVSKERLEWIAFITTAAPNNSSHGKRGCLSRFEKARLAMHHGAAAVIFQVARLFEPEDTDHRLDRPVILVSGENAVRLVMLASNRSNVFLQIKPRDLSQSLLPPSQKSKSNEYFDMAIFMAFFILISLVCLVMLVKMKLRHQRKQSSLTKLAKMAVSNMETRTFASSARESSLRSSDLLYMQCSPSFGIRSCAICLEEFADDQEIRIVPCRHEFHRQCVDPWLIENFTCPLCVMSIVEPLAKTRKSTNRWLSVLPRFLLRRCENGLSPFVDQANMAILRTNQAIFPDHGMPRASSLPSALPCRPNANFKFADSMKRKLAAENKCKERAASNMPGPFPHGRYRCPLHHKKQGPSNFPPSTKDGANGDLYVHCSSLSAAMSAWASMQQFPIKHSALDITPGSSMQSVYQQQVDDRGTDVLRPALATRSSSTSHNEDSEIVNRTVGRLPRDCLSRTSVSAYPRANTESCRLLSVYSFHEIDGGLGDAADVRREHAVVVFSEIGDELATEFVAPSNV